MLPFESMQACQQEANPNNVRKITLWTPKAVHLRYPSLEIEVAKIDKLGKFLFCDPNQNRLQWGRSNLVDLAGSPKIRLLNRDFGNILSISSQEKQQKLSSLNFL